MIEKVVVRGGQQLSSKLTRLKRAGHDLRPYFNIAKTIIWKNTAKRFRDGGGSAGKWAALSNFTLMTRKFGGHQPLQDTSDLMMSVTTEPSVVKLSKRELIIGTNKRQAKLLQAGYRIPVTPAMRGHFLGNYDFWIKTDVLEVPPRPFLYIDRKDKDDLNRGLKYYMKNVIRKGGT